MERSFQSKGLTVELWKLLGDEVVFSLELLKPTQATDAVGAFIEALIIFQDDEQIKNRARALRLKGAAWLAGFPVGNAIMPVARAGMGGLDRDYIGPAMDTGFRLGKLATRRKFALSAELAWLMLAPPVSGPGLPLYYEGRGGLKGVMERDGYPFVWAGVLTQDMQELVRAEEALRPPPHSESGKLMSFLAAFVLKHGEPRHLPFIEGVFGQRSDDDKTDYARRLVNARADLLRLYPELFLPEPTAVVPVANDNAQQQEEINILGAIDSVGKRWIEDF